MPVEQRNPILENHGYKLGRIIGTGSYGLVRVSESELHGNVAVKIVSKFHVQSDYLKEFLPREIQVVRGLEHPNIIKYIQTIETTHRVYIVMEYAENGSLLDIIRRDGHIDEPRARIWFGQLIDAVQYCHDCGVVHRDIKCENLLLDAQYRIKLSDFGFARGSMGKKEGSFVISDTYCGSYAYASPEILKGIPYKPQYSDIWSMGVVLYATVFGRLPFDDTNLQKLIKLVQRQITFPKETTVSNDCKVLITKMLAPLPERAKISVIRQDPWMLIVVPPESIDFGPPNVVYIREEDLKKSKDKSKKKEAKDKERDKEEEKDKEKTVDEPPIVEPTSSKT